MDLFILLGSGLLGAVFMSSQANFLRAPLLWKLLIGCGGGAAVFLTLSIMDRLPNNNTLGALLLLFALGTIAGAMSLLVFQIVRWILKKR